MLLEVLITLILILGVCYIRISSRYDYWKKRGVVSLKAQFPFELLHDKIFGSVSDGLRYQALYNEYYKRRGLKYVGRFSIKEPALIIFDLDHVKHILMKDSNHFVSRDFLPTTHEHISKHLFSLEGQEWRDMRSKLTPTFSSGKMNNMFHLMEKCAEQLQEHIETVIVKSCNGEFKVKNLIGRFTTDIIATCAFGLDVNSIKDPDNEFNKIAELIVAPKRIHFVLYLIVTLLPKLSSLLKINFYDTRITNFLTKVIKDTVSYRKENNVVRKDFIDLLLKVRNNESLDDFNENDNSQTNEKCSNSHPKSKNEAIDKDKKLLTLEEMTAQAFIFFAAGFETAASVTSFCLYELAKHPEIQDKLRREIDEVTEKYGGKVTYEATKEMSYVDQVINETLRMYPSLPILTRVCTVPYRLPGTDLTIEKGVRMLFPIYNFHYDPDIYPDPDNFDPSRFTEAQTRARPKLSYLPFGEGPRSCIGIMFGKLQVKMGLIAMLSKFHLSPARDTPSTLELDPVSIFTVSKRPFSLRVTGRSGV